MSINWERAFDLLVQNNLAVVKENDYRNIVWIKQIVNPWTHQIEQGQGATEDLCNNPLYQSYIIEWFKLYKWDLNQYKYNANQQPFDQPFDRPFY